MKDWQDALVIGLLIGLSLGLLIPPLNHVIEGTYEPSDYPTHIAIAVMMEMTGEIASPHFLFQALILLTRQLVPGLTFKDAAFLVVVVFYALLAGAVYAFIRPSFVSLRDRYAVPWAVLASLSIMIVTPITLLTWPSRNLYFGYIGITVYHNPTMCLLKPLALMLFVLVGRAITGYRSRRFLLMTISICVLMFMTTMAKPSYTICLLPVVAGCMLVRFVRKRQVIWPLAFMGLIGGGVLAYQYFMWFAPHTTTLANMSIGFAPFAAYAHYSSLLFPKFLLSILFPLSVVVVYWKAAMRDVYTKLAWLMFAVGAFYTYFLVELGPDGQIDFSMNFAWSGQITLFVLFVASVRLFILRRPGTGSESTGRGHKLRYYSCLLVLALHLVSGVLFYYRYLIGQGRSWW
ncbi:hypothetical protein ACFLSZ_01700 [Candidatus Bipolaricaulota bacterium]